MTSAMAHGELRRRAVQLMRLRALAPSRAWPRFGQDLVLAEEDGPDGSLLFACRTDESMSNPLGIVHGGLTASLVDTCMGITCAAQCEIAATPTVTMTVNYALPVPLNADIRVRAHTVRVGTALAYMTAEVFLPERPEEVLATASGVYAIRR